MADKTKFLDHAGLQYYDEKNKAYIAAADQAVLDEAKEYASGLADNYDAAGTAQTKVDALANGAVKANTEAIEKLNGTEDEEGSVAKAVKVAKDAIGVDVVRVEGKADQNATDITGLKGRMDAIDATQTGRMAVAEADIDALEETVKNIQENAYDDTEIRGLISGNAGDIDSLEERAEAFEGKVNVLIGDDADKSVRVIANEELAKQLIPETAEEALNELQEIAAWIQSHPGDAAAMNAAITALQNKVVLGVDESNAEYATVKAYVEAAIAALKIDDYAKAADLIALAGKVDVDKVSEAIATAKQEAIDAATAAAAEDATAKANTAEANAKGHANGLNDAMNARVEALEAIDHSHANEAVLNGITAEKVAAWDAAEANAKGHADGLNTAMDSKVNGIGDRVEALEAKVGEGFVAITNAEIDALFAQA